MCLFYNMCLPDEVEWESGSVQRLFQMFASGQGGRGLQSSRAGISSLFILTGAAAVLQVQDNLSALPPMRLPLGGGWFMGGAGDEGLLWRFLS